MNIVFSIMICFLCGFTDVKIADVQIVEVIIILAVATSFLMPQHRIALHGPGVVMNFIPKFVILLILVFSGSLLSLRLHFFPVPFTGPLKQPPYASLIRVVEVAMSIGSMFYVSLAVRDSPDVLRKFLAAFVWSALVGAVWGLISIAGWFLDFKLPGITPGYFPRICGFFVEGGPFGVYLVGAIILQIVRGYYLPYISGRAFYMQLGILLLALLGTQSKASVALAGATAIVFLIRTRHIRLMLVMAIAMIPVVLTSNIIQGTKGYYENYANYQQAAAERPEDTSLIAGRLAASVLLPRIVAQHPLLGVGLGNYALVRNDPAVLQGLPYLPIWDSPGLGLFGYLAELGIPLTMFVLWLYTYPLLKAWRRRPWIVLLCSYPLLAAIFGVQLNFAYPWIVAGLGLAAISIDQRYQARHPVAGRGSPRPTVPSRAMLGR